jgi:transcriptional regulator with XRE-family HTH domain
MQQRLWLSNIRKTKRMTQRELARRCDTTNTTISGIETGARDPSGPLALRIAQELGFDMKRFYEKEA